MKVEENHCDVLIVGGGPAGLAAGIRLAQNGLRVILCEARRFPVDKACGEGIMPTGVQILKEMGLAEFLSAGEYFPFTGIRYHARDGTAASGEFREGVGWGIRRTVLSARLYSLAARYAQISIQEGTRVKAVRQTNSGVTAFVDGGELRARLLIGADGLHSQIREKAGLVDQGKVRKRWGLRQHFLIAPWSEFVEIYWSKGLEAYITPVSPGEVGVAFLWDPSISLPRSRSSELFSFFLNQFPLLRQRLSTAVPSSLVLGAGPFFQKTRDICMGNMILIGDAAGYADAITGEGISVSLAEARTLREVLTPAAVRRLPDAALVDDLSRKIKVEIRISQRLIGFILYLSRHHRQGEWMIRFLARRADLFQHLLSCNMGTSPIWPGLSAALGYLFTSEKGKAGPNRAGSQAEIKTSPQSIDGTKNP